MQFSISTFKFSNLSKAESIGTEKIFHRSQYSALGGVYRIVMDSPGHENFFELERFLSCTEFAIGRGYHMQIRALKINFIVVQNKLSLKDIS